jgi:hypothetical protein
VVSASAGVVTARTAVPSAEVAPGASGAASTAAATAAGSSATAASVVRQPSANYLGIRFYVPSVVEHSEIFFILSFFVFFYRKVKHL